MKIKSIFFMTLALITSVAYADNFNDKVSKFASKFKSENNVVKYKESKDYSRVIYVDSKTGDDKNKGSENSPLKTLKGLETLGVKSGDKILLKGGLSYEGTIYLSKLNNIHIGSYGQQKATIDCKGYPEAVMINNSSDIVVCDIKIKGDGGPDNTSKMYESKNAKINYRAGVYIKSQGEKMKNIYIYNVDIADVYFYNVDDEAIPHDERPCRKWGIKHTNNFSWGIKGEAKGGGVDNLTIEDCHIKAVSRTAIQLNGNLKAGSPFSNLTIKDCSIIKVGGPGLMFSGAKDAVIENTRTYRSGNSDDPRMWGRGSGSWLVWSDNVLYDKNYFERAEGIGDCCGVHIDMGNKNVIVQNCLSKDNAGGFIEILGKNYNCSYRYNISINDGWRNPKDDELQKEFWKVKKEVANSKELFADNAAGSFGCVMTINGHSGKEYVGPFQSYVYNNTIVCSEVRKDNFKNPFIFQIATTAEGVMIANNIFWVPSKFEKGWSVHSYKDGKFHSKAYDYRVPTGELIDGKRPIVRDMNREELAKADLVFENNLYQLYDPSFPKAENVLPNNKAIKGSKNHYYDENALGGNPKFSKTKDWEMAEDLIPQDAKVINRGIEIKKLKSDKTSYGLLPGLKMGKDFFGKTITSPIIGACCVE